MISDLKGDFQTARENVTSGRLGAAIYDKASPILVSSWLDHQILKLGMGVDVMSHEAAARYDFQALRADLLQRVMNEA